MNILSLIAYVILLVISFDQSNAINNNITQINNYPVNNNTNIVTHHV